MAEETYALYLVGHGVVGLWQVAGKTPNLGLKGLRLERKAAQGNLCFFLKPRGRLKGAEDLLLQLNRECRTRTKTLRPARARRTFNAAAFLQNRRGGQWISASANLSFLFAVP